MTSGKFVILGGLPGSGKTTIARALADALNAFHLRIDTIENALCANGVTDVHDLGYRVAYALAEENLRSGATVIADSVNPLRITREAWRAVAERAGAISVEIEITCSDAEEHRRRLESRIDDIPGRSVTWQDVLSREYERWGETHLHIDTSHDTVEAAVTRICELLRTAHSQPLTSALPSLLH